MNGWKCARGTGKMVCTGAKTMALAHEAVHKAISEMKEGGINIQGEPLIVVQNMVASADFHNDIDVEALFDVSDNAMYEPDQFPGLIYRMKRPKVVMLLFSSGKLVCVGAKSKETVSEAVTIMYETLQDYGLLFTPT